MENHAYPSFILVVPPKKKTNNWVETHRGSRPPAGLVSVTLSALDDFLRFFFIFI